MFIGLRASVPLVVQGCISTGVSFATVFGSVITGLRRSHFRMNNDVGLLGRLSSAVSGGGIGTVLDVLGKSPSVRTLFSGPGRNIKIGVNARLGGRLLRGFDLVATACSATNGNGNLVTLLKPAGVPCRGVVDVVGFVHCRLSSDLGSLGGWTQREEF